MKITDAMVHRAATVLSDELELVPAHNLEPVARRMLEAAGAAAPIAGPDQADEHPLGPLDPQ